MRIGKAAAQHKAIAKQERIWAAQAHRDAIYNLKRAQHYRRQGKRVLEQGYMQEYSWDEYWRQRRLRLANKHAKLAGSN